MTGVAEPTDDLVDPDLETYAAGVAEWHLSNCHKIVRWHKRVERQSQKALRRHWRKAFQLYLVSWGAAVELDELVNTQRQGDGVDGDLVFEALLRLHAQACRVAREVYELLRAGLVDGALGRCRTLHEIAVIADVIGEYGRKPEHANMAEQYLLHEGVLAYSDALRYQKHTATLGQVPFTDDELTHMRAIHDGLVDRFGTAYKGTYGWAHSLPRESKNRVELGDLTKIAQAGHLEPYFRWASHQIQVPARGTGQHGGLQRERQL